MSLSPDLTLSFSDFHGMLCSPSTARRCIKSFTGSVLFLPFNKFESATSSDLIPKSSLNLFTYYAMVIYSCTGISSLLGLTIGTCVTHTPTYESLASSPLFSFLSPSPQLIHDCQYYFLFPNFKVKMYHVLTTDPSTGKTKALALPMQLHLVDLYKGGEPVYALTCVAILELLTATWKKRYTTN